MTVTTPPQLPEIWPNVVTISPSSHAQMAESFWPRWGKRVPRAAPRQKTRRKKTTPATAAPVGASKRAPAYQKTGQKPEGKIGGFLTGSQASQKKDLQAGKKSSSVRSQTTMAPPSPEHVAGEKAEKAPSEQVASWGQQLIRQLTSLIFPSERRQEPFNIDLGIRFRYLTSFYGTFSIRCVLY
jgi:hypothetical protein